MEGYMVITKNDTKVLSDKTAIEINEQLLKGKTNA